MYNIPHGGFFKKGVETAKRKCNAGTSKWRQIGDVIEIAKDYRTDVYWGGEVVWCYTDWARRFDQRNYPISRKRAEVRCCSRRFCRHGLRMREIRCSRRVITG